MNALLFKCVCCLVRKRSYNITCQIANERTLPASIITCKYINKRTSLQKDVRVWFLITYSFLRISNISTLSYNGAGGAVRVNIIVVIGGRTAKFMHHPISFGAFSGTSPVVNQSFLQPNAVDMRIMNWLVDSSCFPKPRPSYSIRSDTILVLSPSSAEEVPLLISCSTCRFCIIFHKLIRYNNWSYN